MAIFFDGPSRIISLSIGTTSVGVRELISRWEDWMLVSDNSKYLQAFDQVGGNDIDVTIGTRIPIYGYLMNGWRIRPYEGNHTLTVSDGVLLVDGGGDPFIDTIGDFVIRINYQQPVQAITVTTNGTPSTGLTTQQAVMLEEIWKLHALKPGSPMQVSPTARQVDGISQNIQEVAGTVTISRV